MAAGDITPQDAPPPVNQGGVGQWVADHKIAVGVGTVIVLALGYVFLKKRAAASQSSSSGSTGSVGTSTGPAVYEVAPGYLGAGDYGSTSNGGYQSLLAFEQQLAAQTSGGTTGGSVSGTGAPSSGATTAGSINNNAINLYPVGTTVQPGETITNAVPVPGGFVDTTSEGGLYGSGVNVSGSLFNGQQGNYSAQYLGGNQIEEFGPAGTKVFTFK